MHRKLSNIQNSKIASSYKPQAASLGIFELEAWSLKLVATSLIAQDRKYQMLELN